MYTVIQNVNNGENCVVCMLYESDPRKVSVLAAQCIYKSKTILKSEVYKRRKKF